MFRFDFSVRTLRKLNQGGEVISSVDMSKYSTFKCGGRAKVLVLIKTLEGFVKVTKYLKDKSIEYFVIGAGSNILVSDKGYNGVVLKLSGDLARIESTGDNTIEVGAGVKLSKIFAYTSSNNLSGLEDGAGIPATIGGAVYMNASAYNYETAKLVEYVVAYLDGKLTYFDKDACKFSYRHSVFQDNGAIIVRVGLKFKPLNKQDIMQRFNEVSKMRATSQPLNKPSAGCVFKKVEGIEVSKCLDLMGLKGLTVGDAQVSIKHANFIINLGEAKAQDIYKLISLIQTKFEETYNILLETEIKFLGEF